MAAISSAPQPRVAALKRAQSYSNTWSVALKAGLIAGDTVAINGAFIGIYVAYLDEIRRNAVVPDGITPIVMAIVLFNLISIGVFAFNSLYDLRRGASRVDEAFKAFTAISLTTVLAMVINTSLPELNSAYESLPWPTTIVVSSWITAILSVVTLRFFHRKLVFWLRSRGIDTRRVLIVGARDPGQAVLRTIRRLPELGYTVQGFLSDSVAVGAMIEDVPVLGLTSQVGRVARATQADEIVIALSGRSSSDLLDVVALVEDESVSIKIYPDTFQLITNNDISIGDLSGLPLVSVKNAALDYPLNRALKRGLDLITSIVVLLICAPLMFLIALLIKIESRGPVFFLQERVGMDNNPFWVIKFRTMRSDAESRGPGWTTANDSRVTRLGRFLRRTSIDELPQFINVMLGEMSVVGPRPEQPLWVKQFSQKIPRYMRRHKEKAGITGWAQINGLRGDTSIEERTRYDLYYIENWSLLFDVKIILGTIVDFLTGKQENAY
ncbi:MAG: undecaprenyl-phosphate glucose phosphotransferase [Chloroflexales bacterium]|nr:undecaprenyl-phosphate glucose phosphotransferase [Chloroflexales bacterium]